ALVVGDDYRIARNDGRGEPAVHQRLLAPELRAGAAAQSDDLAIRSRDIDIVAGDRQAAIARHIVRPPDLAGIAREHRNLALELRDVHIVAFRARGRIDIVEPRHLVAALWRGDQRLP